MRDLAAGGQLPLVGRTAELELVVSILQAGASAGVVLAGPAGVGKTRLASEAARRAPDLGLSVANLVASAAAASVPFGPLIPLLPDGDETYADQFALMRAIERHVIERAGKKRGLLLVVDDAHLLDDASAAVIHQLAARQACLVLMTARTGDKTPASLTALWKDGLAERVDLAPLGEEDVAGLASAVLDGPLDGRSARRLWSISGGNALYLRELIRGAVEAGTLTTSDGVWILGDFVAPPRLVELLSERLDGLPESTTRVVDILSLAGSLGLSHLESLTSTEATDDAERRGLIQVLQDGSRIDVRLAHPLYGEVRRSRLTAAASRQLLGSLAVGLAAGGARRRGDVLRLATWQIQAGIEGDSDLLTQAAREARAMFDRPLAAQLARAALAAGGGVPAGLTLAEALFAEGHHGEADEELARLESLCQNDGERLLVVGARSYNLSILMGDPDAAVRLLDRTMALVTDPAARLGLQGRMGLIHLFQGQPTVALATVEPSLRSDQPAVSTRAWYIASCAHAQMGHFGQAVETSTRGLESHRRWPEATQLPETHLIGALLAHAGAGELKLAEAAALVGYRATVEAGDQEGTATFALFKGYVWVLQGRLPDAANSFREGVAVNRVLKDKGALRWCLGGVALAEALAGRSDQARHAGHVLDSVDRGWFEIFEPDVVVRGRAWVDAAAGQLTSARRLLAATAERAGERSQYFAEALLLHDIARLGQAHQAAVRLAELAGLVEGKFVIAMAEHAAALWRGGAADLEAAANQFDALGANQLAYEAASSATTAYRAAGLSRRANACANFAAEKAVACGLSSPSLEGDVAGRLSIREREVAGLVAAGLSSREVASRLFISVRTVESHLQRIYSKLGVGTREQLAGALGHAAKGS